MNNKTISDFLKNEYAEYARYVLENRAIPSFCDGLKPTQRKIVYVSDKFVRSEEKVFAIGGKVSSEASYHHGDKSCNDAIIGMVEEYKNNLPLLKGTGTYGTLKNTVSASPRYLEAQLSPYFDMLYKDKELLEYKEFEGKTIEPYFYLPIIPMILINGSSGIAVGHATNILNRDPLQVIDACISVLNKKPFTPLLPKINGFVGTFTADTIKERKWIIEGKYEVINSYSIKITEIPPSLTLEKYEVILDELEDKKIISGYDNYSSDIINYVVKIPREKLASMTSEDIISTFKLREFDTENFTTLNEQGKLKIFNSCEELINTFVEFRLQYYEKRKLYEIDKLNKEITFLDKRSYFIESVINGKIVINNKTKKEIVESIEKLNILPENDSYDFLLSMPLWSLTKERIDEINKKIKDNTSELKLVKKRDNIATYIKELEDLKLEINRQKKKEEE